jgi:hypothetical protein
MTDYEKNRFIKTGSRGGGLALALILTNTNSGSATPRESKMEQKCWNQKDTQCPPA